MQHKLSKSTTAKLDLYSCEKLLWCKREIIYDAGACRFNDNCFLLYFDVLWDIGSTGIVKDHNFPNGTNANLLCVSNT